MNEKILGLIDELNKATLAYDEGKPYMSDEQWDEKYFELVELEAEHNFYDSNSPTQKVVYQVVNALEKVEHNHPMLSLDKTKSLKETISHSPPKSICLSPISTTRLPLNNLSN